MAEATHADMNQTDLAPESAQQMAELQPPLSSQPTDFSPNYLQQQQQHVEDEVTIDIKKLIQNCKDGRLLPDCCIYKVPITLRHLKEEAYTPQVVSIGPFHYGNERLQHMESHKQILFKRFTQRAMSSLDDLVRFVKHLEPKVRASYSETINLTKKELVNLTLMDAGFIIELFIMYHEVDEVRNDAKLSQPWLPTSIFNDLVLLENQLPFFVIEELFNQAFPHHHRGSLPSFHRLMYNYFRYDIEATFEPNPDIKIKHFTDLIRLFYLQEKKFDQHSFSKARSHAKKKFDQHSFSKARSHILLYNAEKKFDQHLYNANALQNAGIQLNATKSKCLLDLNFSGHIFEIPQILVDDCTELYFRNMIALEQCHYGCEAYITDYALVWDWLIDTSKDVDLLVDKEIVCNRLGDSNNVALLFNGLGENVARTNFNYEYSDICQRLNGYYQQPWNKLMATMRRDYCQTPLQARSIAAGTLLLFLTIVQTICSFRQVV